MYISTRYIDAIVKPIFSLSATQTRSFWACRNTWELAVWPGTPTGGSDLPFFSVPPNLLAAIRKGLF